MHPEYFITRGLTSLQMTMVCSSDDALNMFYGSDLQNLAMVDFLVRKST
jgi:predicted NodU family carbamoyl transferase